MQRLRVVTWNLLGRDPVRVGLDRLIALDQPDVLLLQEADGAAIAGHGPLALAYRHRFVDPRAGYRPGMAILSAHEIAGSGRLDGPRRIFDRPRLLWVDLRLPDGSTVRAASVHTAAPDSLLPPPYNPIRRNRQLRAIASFACRELDEGRRLLIGGDFNTVRYRIPRMTDVADAGGRPEATWRGLPVRWMPRLLRLDRIFVGPTFRVEEARVGREFHGSDHCPVIATIRLS